MGFILYLAIFFIIIVIFINSFIKKKSFFVKKHFLFLLLFAEYLMFTFISPLYGYVNDIDTVFGNNIKEYYDPIMIIYSIAIFSFFIGYMTFIGRKRFKISKSTSIVVSKKYVRIFFIIALISVLLWSKLTNFGITNILFMEDIEKSGFSGGYNYLLFMMEFSIGAMILAYFSNMKSVELLMWASLFSLIFLLFGFRYRLIMVILVLLSIYIIKNDFNKKSMKKFILITLIGLIGFSLFSNLKSVGRNLGTASNVEANIATFDEFGHLFHKNTHNYLSFMSLYKCLEGNQCNYDYGHTIFAQTLYRAIPASFFDNNTKPPSYALEDLYKSFGSLEGYKAGASITNIGHFYYSFSILGVAFGMMLLGIFVAYITNSFLYTLDTFSTFVYILAIALSFHFISRGYIPQLINDLIFIMFPMLVLLFQKKLRRLRF